MRKASIYSIAVFSAFFVFCLTLALSCENLIMQEILELKVISFNSNGGSSIPSQRLLKGQLLKQPDDPVKTDFLFDGWYVDNDTFAQKWDFNSSPVEDLTLHAKWIVEYISITHAAVAVTAPVTDHAPDTVAEPDTKEGEVNFSVGAVSWSPDHNLFRPSTRYTASVTLTAYEGYLFIGLTSAAVNGYPAEVSGNTGSAVTLSLTFEATEAKDASVNEIAVLTQPRLVYNEGEALDLSGLTVKITYTDGFYYSPVLFEEFDSMGIKTSLTHGETLYHLAHNNNQVTVTLDNCSVKTANLTVKELGAAGITLMVQHITEGAPLPDNNITLSQSNTNYSKSKSITITLSDYDPGSVKWEIFGAGSSADVTVTNTATFTLDAADIRYNSLGGHTLRLSVKIGGVPYMRNINFTIVK